MVATWGYDYVLVRPDRDRIAREQSTYQAWQVINTASGKSGLGGRLRALKHLNEAKQTLHGTNLDGLTVTSDAGFELLEMLFHLDSEALRLNHISLKGAILVEQHAAYQGRGIDLHGVTLRNISGANLRFANLSRARLAEADLSNADLERADLSGAYLTRANLDHADLEAAILFRLRAADANFAGADLSYANLRYAKLEGANLDHADLSHTNLRNAKLKGASLDQADLHEADLHSTDLRDTTGLTTGQIAEAYWDKSTGFPYGFREKMISDGLPVERMPPNK